MLEAAVTQAEVETWYRANKLTFNQSKTQQISFTLRWTDKDQTDSGPEVVKFLGVYLDSRLSWEGHILGLSKRLSKQMFLLRQLSNEVSRNVLRFAHYLNFHSSLSYAILNWGHSSHSSKVFAQQRKCMRILGRLKYRGSCRQEFVN